MEADLETNPYHKRAPKGNADPPTSAAGSTDNGLSDFWDSGVEIGPSFQQLRAKDKFAQSAEEQLIWTRSIDTLQKEVIS